MRGALRRRTAAHPEARRSRRARADKDERGRPHTTLYFWLGPSSSQDEKGAAALITVRMAEALGGEPTQVRVVGGKEPVHFVALWGGKLVVHSGGRASGFRTRKDVDTYDADGVSLFHVYGTSSLDTKAVQVAETAAWLPG